MTDLAPYIKQLLYRHECVIIPSFGGVVAQYSSAQIHPVQNVFSPPNKSLAFNKGLCHNDGLLASEIVRITGVSYEAASLAIGQYVRKLESDLKTKGQTVIPEIGKFFFDIENNLIFESSTENNFLSQSFGFDRFISSPVLRRTEALAQVEALVAPQKKNHRRTLVAVSTVVLALIAFFQLITYDSPMNPMRLNKSDLLKSLTSVFSPEKNSVTAEADNHRKDTLIQIVVIQPNGNLTPVNSISKNISIDSASHLNLHFSPGAEAIAFANSFRQPDTLSTDINPETKGPKYYLIFACFKSQSRTEKFIAQMKEKGLNVSVLIQDSYIRIGNGVFTSKEEAAIHQQEFHDQGFHEVWIMKR